MAKLVEKIDETLEKCNIKSEMLEKVTILLVFGHAAEHDLFVNMQRLRTDSQTVSNEYLLSCSRGGDTN